jgi:sugar phosphate isomerase/epimerase
MKPSRSCDLIAAGITLVNRRTFLKATAGAAAAAQLPAAITSAHIPMGLNTYCLRAMKWNDVQLIDYTAGLKLDAVFLQDSLDPEAMVPSHWSKIRDYAASKGLHLETGTGAVLPKSPADFDASVNNLTTAIERAKTLGSPIVRCLHASDREHLPPGPIEQHIDTMVKVLRAIRQRAMDAGVKIAIENHKDLLAWEMRQVMEGAGKEFVGSYLDTGNPMFVLEHPMTTLEVLGPLALTVHLRDSILYETKDGVAVQWVPLGEGIVDFKAFVARMREICPPVYVYIKPITGRPPQELHYLEADYWKKYPDVKAADFARFLALAKQGHPYEKPMVVEDLQNRAIPAEFLTAVQFQQRDHMQRSVEYAKKTLDLGVRWR